jgi:2-methylisocitrate lyase-like PEP mutase family enzyme
VSDQAEKARTFLALHAGERPLLMPNPWDAGSAVLLASLGFQALATTSSGFAATLGQLDGSVTRERTLENAAAIVGATELPVSADLENAFADDPDGVAETVRLALRAGLAGCSVEDSSGREDAPIYELGAAAERIAAAAEVAHGGPVHLVLTARAENYLHGRPDLADTITRLQAFQTAGADVLYAPGVLRLEDIRELVSAVDLPRQRPCAPRCAPGLRARGRGSQPGVGWRRLRVRRPGSRRGSRRRADRGRDLHVLRARQQGRAGRAFGLQALRRAAGQLVDTGCGGWCGGWDSNPHTLSDKAF